jgi:hypothetical protein
MFRQYLLQLIIGWLPSSRMRTGLGLLFLRLPMGDQSKTEKSRGKQPSGKWAHHPSRPAKWLWRPLCAAHACLSICSRHIGDFTRWKNHDAYQKALDRLLRDLRIERV